MREKYKNLEISTADIHKNDRQKIINFFNSFNEQDINIKFSGNKLTVNLFSLDFHNFEEKVNLAANNGLKNSNTSRILKEIFNRIEGIKSYGLKGKKRLYVDYNKERKVKDRTGKENKRNQYYYSKNNDFKEINNELPNEFVDRIICADSKEILKNLPDNCVDLIFTSPPYNFGLEYTSNDDDHHWENYFRKLFEIFDECIRVLKYGGRIIINVQPLFSDYIPSHHMISNYFMEKKMIWKGEILWEKNNYNCKYTAWGSWKSPGNPYLKYTWEFIEIFSKGSLKKEGLSINADITADEFKKWVVAKWSIAPERKMKQYGHPAMFPEELVFRVIRLFSFENDIILDPFNGAGTTTLVAKKLKRKYLGIDISKEYCAKAEERLNSILL